MSGTTRRGNAESPLNQADTVMPGLVYGAFYVARRVSRHKWEMPKMLDRTSRFRPILIPVWIFGVLDVLGALRLAERVTPRWVWAWLVFLGVWFIVGLAVFFAALNTRAGKRLSRSRFLTRRSTWR